MKEKY